jgi:zinc protease
MKINFRRPLALFFGLLFFASTGTPQTSAQQTKSNKSAQAKSGFSVPVEYFKLPNGLRVVMSQDKTAPTVVTAVYYNIGFRLEPRNRTGFAHLFEHLMFQGTDNLSKDAGNKLIPSIGGIQNGSTRFDYTNYYEVVPSHKLETMLWYEADRMRGIKITEENIKNQQGVVTNEVKVNVLNQPYGGFPWLDMPQYANTNWANAHNFYGDLKDLEAANEQDAKEFFKTYYAPNNAVLAIVGDFEIADAKKMVEKYFASIPAQKLAPKPDLTEPRQEQEKRASKKDALARRPALGIAYHMPERNTPDYYAMGLIDQILIQREDSLLFQELVKAKGYAGGIGGGVNPGLGNMFNYSGPMLWVVNLIHDNNVKPEQILASVDGVVAKLQNEPVDAATLDRARVKLMSGLYDYMTALGGFGRADLLASFALFDDNPQKINAIEAEFRRVTPEQIQKTAREYLRAGNRTVLTIEPAAPAAQAGAAK